MKYRLKKDLPFAKAGTKVYSCNGNDDFGIIEEDCFVICELKNHTKDFSIYQYRGSLMFIGEKQNLIDEGWIEEVKPKEWYVKEFEGGSLSHMYDKREVLSQLLGGRIFKVREVIDG